MKNLWQNEWFQCACWIVLAITAFNTFDQFSPWSLRINTTNSIPRGLYLATAHHSNEPLLENQIACYRYNPPQWAVVRNYTPVGMPICKYVLALPGDELRVTTTTVSRVRAGMVSSLGTRIQKDKAGLPVPPLDLKDSILKNGEYWLGSLYNLRSFDSRYVGPIQSADINVTLVPLLTE